MDTQTRRMITAMLAEGHPTWYIAAMVNKPTRTIESLAHRLGNSNPRRTTRPAA